jgi:hypothetical protein
VISILFGWTLFFYWWWVVLRREQTHDVVHVLSVVFVCSIAFVLLAYSWVWHNVRLGHYESRIAEAVTRPPGYEHDALGRSVSLPMKSAVQSAPIVVVDATEALKTFSMQRATRA